MSSGSTISSQNSNAPDKTAGSGGNLNARCGAQAVIERPSDSSDRLLRVEQAEIFSLGGEKVHTSIQVLEPKGKGENGEYESVFCVKHTHGQAWPKELNVHKNLLLACILAETPCPIEIPQSSINMFNSAENPQHIHLYLEKILPHLRFPHLGSDVSVFWWRAVGHGSLLFLNWTSGKILILPNLSRSIPTAGETLRRGLDVARDVPSSFTAIDEAYAKLFPNNSPKLSEEKKEFPSSQSMIDTLQSWAMEDNVSPWMTKLIVKTKLPNKRGQVTNFRYSIGVEFSDENSAAASAMARTGPESGDTNTQLRTPATSTQPEQTGSGAFPILSLQVHCNEPFSRELKAFPVCMVPIPLKSQNVQEVGETYLKSLWFLRKAFDYHVRIEQKGRDVADQARKAHKPGISSRDTKPLEERMKLVGGARLIAGEPEKCVSRGVARGSNKMVKQPQH